jgi:putative membrane protein
MAEIYLTLKALHIVAVISWMVGLLYLPRLFVYHVDAIAGGELDKTLILMERRLYRFIMLPAMLLTLGLGIILVGKVGMSNLGGWFHLKVLLVLGLFALHGMLGKYRREFAENRNVKSKKFFRIINEIPTLLLIIIVILAVVKPF